MPKLKMANAILISLYTISLLLSMAAMELLGWLTAITGSAYWLIQNNLSFKKIFFELRKQKLIFSLFSVVILYFIVVAVGAGYAATVGHDFFKVIGEARWLLLFPLLIFAAQNFNPNQMEKLYLAVVILGAIVGLYSFVQHFYGFDFVRGSEEYMKHASLSKVDKTYYWRSRGFFTHPLTYANVMAVFVCLPAAYLATQNFKSFKMTWLVSLVCFLFVTASIVTTYARGAWLAYVAAIAVMLIIQLPLKKSMGVLLGSLSVLAIIINQNNSLKIRFLSIFMTEKQSARFNLWSANWEMFKDHPFFGIGYNLNRFYAKEYLESLSLPTSFLSHAHNIYLQILAGTGALGLTSFVLILSIVGTIIYKNFKTSNGFIRTISLAALGATISILFGGFTEANFVDGEVNHMLVFMWALVLGQQFKANSGVKQ